MQDKRQLLIYDGHRRWKRLWQFFFTGWGLILIAALVAGSLFTKQLLWTPISAINMSNITTNQFNMSGASFSGTDQNGNPFTMTAASARLEYKHPNTVFVKTISGKVVRITDGKKIRDDFRAQTGEYNIKNKTIKLIGNVRVDSDNGDKILTNELVIKL